MQCCLWTVVVFFVSTVLLYLYSFFCHCSIKRLLNAFASTAYTDSCDCFANYITNMNYNIRLIVISTNCKNCSIGYPYNLFLRFPPLRVGAGFSSLAFSVAPRAITNIAKAMSKYFHILSTKGITDYRVLLLHLECVQNDRNKINWKHWSQMLSFHSISIMSFCRLRTLSCKHGFNPSSTVAISLKACTKQQNSIEMSVHFISFAIYAS